MSKIKDKKRETSWDILTFNDLKGIKTKDNVEEKIKNMTEESLKTQDNQDEQDNDDYAWEKM